MTNIFIRIFNHSINAGWLVLAVIVITFFAWGMQKKFCIMMWAIVALRLLIPISFEMPFSLVPQSDYLILEKQDTEKINEINQNDNDKQSINSSTIYENIEVEENTNFADKAWIGGFIWILGIVIISFLFIKEYIKMKKITAISIKKEKNIRICDNIDSPFLFGLFHPIIYFPSNMPEEYEEYVLLHETSHLKRRDNLWKLIGIFLVIIYWFNPLIWIAYFMFSRDLEFSCDEMVIKKLNYKKRKEYSNALLSLSVAAPKTVIYRISFGELSVKERVEDILKYKKSKFWVSMLSFICVIVVVIFFTTIPMKYYTNVSMKLDKAITESILEHGKETHTAYSYPGFEEHKILGVHENNNKFIVYLMRYYSEFTMENGKLKSGAGSFGPLVLTFYGNEKSGYDLKKIWEPKDGDEYASSIKNKFPRKFWDEIFSEEKHDDGIFEKCDEKAKEYFKVTSK